MKRLKLGDAIGKGAFGVVFKALHLDTGKVYAVKQIKTSQMGSLELRDIMSEIDLLKNLYHDNIVSYQGFSQTVDHLNIIMEYCENGSLHSILQKFGNFPESLIALYVAQVLEGLEYLHGQDVIHRDIKAANILTTKSGTVKLADFGISSKLATGLSEHNSIMGSPFWMSPEIIQLEGAVKTSDIWSVGCTVIELLEGKPPYYSYDPMSVLFNIVQDNHPPFPETVISKDLHNFLKMCWIKDCSVRPSAEILLSHAWIQKSQHKQVTAKPKSATRMPSTPNRNEPNSQFIIPEPPGQLDWDDDFLFDDDDEDILESTPCPSPRKTRCGGDIHKFSISVPTKLTPIKTKLPLKEKKTTIAVMTLPAENWDEDFEFDQEVNPNILGGNPHSLSSLQASARFIQQPPPPQNQLQSVPTSATQTTPHRPAATLDSSDYTQDFDFADFRESLFEKRAACGTSILETCSKEAALGFLGKIEARAAGKDEPIMDACFELVAILNISPKVRETVVAGNSLGLLVGILEDSVTDQEILSLMTLLNKLLCEDTQTKDRLALIGIAQVFMKHGSSKSLDIRREILFFISEMATKANTICALLAARIWPLLVSQYLEMRDSRTREVAFETVCSIAKVLRGIPDKKLVADQVCVLCAGTRQEILFRKLKEILSYLFGERQQQPTRNGNIWESALYLYSLAVACTKVNSNSVEEQADIKKILEYATKQGIYPINKTQ